MRARPEDLPKVKDADFPLSSENGKRSEAEAFVRLHGYTIEAACELVCMSVEDYHKSSISPQSMISYLPTPEMIADMCAEIRKNRPQDPDPEVDLREDKEDDGVFDVRYYDPDLR